jgi:hypothetical protein
VAFYSWRKKFKCCLKSGTLTIQSQYLKHPIPISAFSLDFLLPPGIKPIRVQNPKRDGLFSAIASWITGKDKTTSDLQQQQLMTKHMLDQQQLNNHINAKIMEAQLQSQVQQQQNEIILKNLQSRDLETFLKFRMQLLMRSVMQLANCEVFVSSSLGQAAGAVLDLGAENIAVDATMGAIGRGDVSGQHTDSTAFSSAALTRFLTTLEGMSGVSIGQKGNNSASINSNARSFAPRSPHLNLASLQRATPFIEKLIAQVLSEAFAAAGTGSNPADGSSGSSGGSSVGSSVATTTLSDIVTRKGRVGEVLQLLSRHTVVSCAERATAFDWLSYSFNLENSLFLLYRHCITSAKYFGIPIRQEDLVSSVKHVVQGKLAGLNVNPQTIGGAMNAGNMANNGVNNSCGNNMANRQMSQAALISHLATGPKFGIQGLLLSSFEMEEISRIISRNSRGGNSSNGGGSGRRGGMNQMSRNQNGNGNPYGFNNANNNNNGNSMNSNPADSDDFSNNNGDFYSGMFSNDDIRVIRSTFAGSSQLLGAMRRLRQSYLVASHPFLNFVSGQLVDFVGCFVGGV